MPPVYEMMSGLANLLQLRELGLPKMLMMLIEGIVLLILFVVGNLLLPFVFIIVVAWAHPLLTGSGEPYGQREVVAAFGPLCRWGWEFGWHIMAFIF